MSKNLDEQIVNILNESKRLEVKNEFLKKCIDHTKNLIKNFSLNQYVWDGDITMKCHDELHEFLHDKIIGALNNPSFEDAQDVLKKMEDMG